MDSLLSTTTATVPLDKASAVSDSSATAGGSCMNSTGLIAVTIGCTVFVLMTMQMLVYLLIRLLRRMRRRPVYDKNPSTLNKKADSEEEEGEQEGGGDVENNLVAPVDSLYIAPRVIKTRMLRNKLDYAFSHTGNRIPMGSADGRKASRDAMVYSILAQIHKRIIGMEYDESYRERLDEVLQEWLGSINDQLRQSMLSKMDRLAMPNIASTSAMIAFEDIWQCYAQWSENQGC